LVKGGAHSWDVGLKIVGIAVIKSQVENGRMNRKEVPVLGSENETKLKM
jgi:hypothetical protein